MKKLFLLFTLLLTLSVHAQDAYQATWESLKQYQCPEWFRDAKFGIFIHWGVYSVPAFTNEWYARNMYMRDTKEFTHHRQEYGPQDKFGYKDFIPQFTASKFDADAWMKLFKEAGARYVVPVAEHHDGFAMYNTALSRWNAFQMGPKRDIIGELSAAAGKHGIIFGLSSHRIEHWWFMNGGNTYDSDTRDPAYADFYGPAHQENETMSPEFMNDWLMRNIELVDKYKPRLVWFDWWIEQPALAPYRKSFASYYYNQARAWNAEVVINYKLDAFPEGTAVYDIERGSSKASRKFPWQTDTSVGKKSWGYIDGEENKDANELVDALIDIVSKNGNLLLNIGPRADGTITEGQQRVLRDIGQWLTINGEAIFETRPWKISGEGPTENPDENIKFNEYAFKGYTPADIRFTQKGNTVFLLVMGVPAQPVQAKALATTSGAGKVKRITLLGSSENISWRQTDKLLSIVPPKKAPSPYALAFRIEFE